MPLFFDLRNAVSFVIKDTEFALVKGHINISNRKIIFEKGCVHMYQNKPGSNNPVQKGKRRQKLHEEQNNRGEAEKKTSYTNDK